MKKFFVLTGLLVLTALLIAPITIVPSGGGGAPGPGGDAGGTNSRIANLNGLGTNTSLMAPTLIDSTDAADFLLMTNSYAFFAKGAFFFAAGGVQYEIGSSGLFWGGGGGSVLVTNGQINLGGNITLDPAGWGFFTAITNVTALDNIGNVFFEGNLTNTGAVNVTGGQTNWGAHLVKGTTQLTGGTNNGSFTNAGNFYNTGSSTNGTGFTNGGPLLVRGTSLLTGGTNNGDYTNSGNIYNNGTLTNGGAANILGGVTNWGAMQTKGTADFAGSVTNESRVNTAGGVTNWTQMEVKGTLLANSNLLVNAGQGPANSLSNVWVGGTYFQQIGTAFTNLNGAGTMSNLANMSITGNTLTNNGDTLFAEWGIKLQITKENTNQFQLLYGATTMLDTGLQIASNCTVRATCTISRTGNASQHVEAHLEWGPGGGVPFAFTNANLEMAENNGIANILKAMGGARAVGAHTNNFFRVEWKPTPR